MKLKRKIIRIHEELCNGCGACITSCAEGALKLIDGKARLVKEQFCDGLGACIGTCPTGALIIEEREAEDYDAYATRAHLLATQGEEALHRFDAAARTHSLALHPEMHAHPSQAASGEAGCPGMRMRQGQNPQGVPLPPHTGTGPKQALRSELNQWPVQLHLVRPNAPFFKGKELVIMSTCAPLASADVHWRFLRGRALVVACPKLDRTDGYVEKLAAILSEPSLPQVVVVRMEVPCCSGLTAMAQEARARCGRSDLKVEEVVVGLNGDI